MDVYGRAALLRTLVGLCAWVALGLPIGLAQDAARRNQPLSWTYQLQGNLDRVRQSAADVAVVDIDHVATNGGVASLRRRPQEPPRAIISYLSIGEAETSRPYWNACCATAPPPWLTERTQGWAGNYLVRYWDPRWQALVEARLMAVIAAGFDGVYLDRIDSWESKAGEHPAARADMIAFVRKLSRTAKALKPDFQVFVQNGEELLDDDAYLAAIDGIGKEDLFFGAEQTGVRNPAEWVRHSIDRLDRVRAQRKPVLVVEYLPDGPDADRVRAEAAALGYALTFADRALSGGREPAK